MSFDGIVVTLKNKHSGCCLDAGPDREICQWEENGAEHQKFRLQSCGDEKYHIISEADGKALDVAGGDDDDGAELIKYDLHGGENQQWEFEPAGDGCMIIRSAIGDHRTVDVPDHSTDNGTRIKLWGKNGGDNQAFHMQFDLNDRVVTIRNKASGMALDAGPDRNICQWEQNGAEHQNFRLVHAGENKYHIICEKDGMALDLAGGEDEDGAEIIKYDFHGGINQQWLFEPAPGGFSILSAKGNRRAIDVPGGSCESCNLCLWETHGGDNQVFFFA